MKRLIIKYIFLLITAILLALAVGVTQSQKFSIRSYVEIGEVPVIRPDYSDTIIPYNIAPLNFYIKEPAEEYFVKIYSKKGPSINIYSKAAGIGIPFKNWRKLLNENRGNTLYFEIFIKKTQSSNWEKYRPITNKIAEEKIDSFLVYRYLYPHLYRKQDIKIIMRNLENYDKKLIVDSKVFKGCINCHTFLKNKPEKFTIQIRRQREGYRNYLSLIDRNKISLISPKLIRSGSSYLAWHPSGNLVCLTMDMDYKIVDLFYGNTEEARLEYIDTDANLAIYNINANTLTTSWQISKEDRIEMQPSWSPDGKYLYYISAKKMPIEEYTKIKYDLMRISYDAGENTWGVPETIISSSDTGLSVTFPRVSPDGKYVLFCMTDRGSLSIYRPVTDLYLMDSRTNKFRRLEINSNRADSYHSWSSSSRWFVFISKREEGVFGKPFFCYIDENGIAYKPFIMPQKDPYFYESLTKSFSVPELISEPINLNRFSFGKKLSSEDEIREVTVTSGTADTHQADNLKPKPVILIPSGHENELGGEYKN